jgi:hypothetical protein
LKNIRPLTPARPPLTAVPPAAANTSSTPKSPSGRPAVSAHLPRRHGLYSLVITSPGRNWFACADCHADVADHPLLQSFEMIFACKKCKKCFRKDAREFEDRCGTLEEDIAQATD